MQIYSKRSRLGWLVLLATFMSVNWTSNPGPSGPIASSDVGMFLIFREDSEAQETYVSPWQPASFPGFSYTGDCPLTLAGDAMRNPDGSKLVAYQCIDRNGDKQTMYRALVTFLNEYIADKETFFETQLEGYATLGPTSAIQFSGVKAVKTTQQISIYGRPFSQRTISLLHRNRNYVFAVTSNEVDLEARCERFFSQIRLK